MIISFNFFRSIESVNFFKRSHNVFIWIDSALLNNSGYVNISRSNSPLNTTVIYCVFVESTVKRSLRRKTSNSSLYSYSKPSSSKRGRSLRVAIDSSDVGRTCSTISLFGFLLCTA